MAARGVMRAMLLAALLCGGCVVGDTTGGAPQEDEAADLGWVQENVFTPSCAGFSACHPRGADLDLEAGHSFDALVGVTSTLAPGMHLVEPGAPDESYLMVILGQYGAGDARLDPEVGTMPPDTTLLSAEKRDAVESWIGSL